MGCNSSKQGAQGAQTAKPPQPSTSAGEPEKTLHAQMQQGDPNSPKGEAKSAAPAADTSEEVPTKLEPEQESPELANELEQPSTEVQKEKEAVNADCVHEDTEAKVEPPPETENVESGAVAPQKQQSSLSWFCCAAPRIDEDDKVTDAIAVVDASSEPLNISQPTEPNDAELASVEPVNKVTTAEVARPVDEKGEEAPMASENRSLPEPTEVKDGSAVSANVPPQPDVESPHEVEVTTKSEPVNEAATAEVAPPVAEQDKEAPMNCEDHTVVETSEPNNLSSDPAGSMPQQSSTEAPNEVKVAKCEPANEATATEKAGAVEMQE